MTSRKKKPQPKTEMKRNLRPIRFRGFDWTELGQVFGLDRITDDHLYAFVIKERLARAASVTEGFESGDRRLAKWQLKQARNFLVKISESDHHYDSKVWYEIAVLKHDITFVKWLTAFLECAWT